MIVHDFYAVMREFVINTDNFNKNEYILESLQLIIISQNLHFLAETDYFSDISEKVIRDKTKTDLLAQSLTCLQAG